MNENKELNPWERQPKETQAAYAAFSEYLEAEPPRFLRKLWAKDDPIKLDRRHVSCPWERWSKLWDWLERSAAYDADRTYRVREVAQKALETDIIELERAKLKSRMETLELASQIREKAREMLGYKLDDKIGGATPEMIKKAIEAGDLELVKSLPKGSPVKWRMADAAKLAAIADQLMLSATEGIQDEMERALPEHYRRVIMGEESMTPSSVEEITATVKEINKTLDRIHELQKQQSTFLPPGAK